MEKRIWSKPEMNEFVFAANEYVATSCGDGGTTDKFTCDAGEGTATHVGYGSLRDPKSCWCGTIHTSRHDFEGDRYFKVYQDNNGVFGEQIASRYHACGETHEATVGKGESFGDVFFAGWMDDRLTDVVEKIKVMIWRGADGDNCHCTENLNVSTWEIAKS